MNTSSFFSFLTIILMFSCNNKIQNPNETLSGKYFFSQNTNLSYFFPEGFKEFIPQNDRDYNIPLEKIRNKKLKEQLSKNYIEKHILPIANNFQYLFKEDKTNYQNIFINEVDYFRLNDVKAEILSSLNRRQVNLINNDTSKQVNLNKEYIINKNEYQIIVNKGDIIINTDTVFWENFLVSKFYRTFSIQIESNSRINFLPYINNIKFGDKRI